MVGLLGQCVHVSQNSLLPLLVYGRFEKGYYISGFLDYEHKKRSALDIVVSFTHLSQLMTYQKTKQRCTAQLKSHNLKKKTMDHFLHKRA